MELAHDLHAARRPADRPLTDPHITDPHIVDRRPVDVAALGSRVAPLTMSRERTLPIAEMFGDLFAEGGLVRGRTLVCDGPAATSLALALIAPAIAAGSWLAMIDLPAIGLDAASELGVPLERVVAVSSGDEPGRLDRWPEVVAAAADGFDVLLVDVPLDVSAATLRRVTTRIRQRGAVMLAIGDPGQLAGDGVLHSGPSYWSGLGDGHGYLRRREFAVQAVGRRFPDRRRCRLALPAGSPVEPLVAVPAGSPAEPPVAVELPAQLPA